MGLDAPLLQTDSLFGASPEGGFDVSSGLPFGLVPFIFNKDTEYNGSQFRQHHNYNVN